LAEAMRSMTYASLSAIVATPGSVTIRIGATDGSNFDRLA